MSEIYSVIDVSHWQGSINFNMVKAAGIWGVIIKAGGSDAGLYTDPRFEENYRNAKAAGLHGITPAYAGTTAKRSHKHHTFCAIEQKFYLISMMSLFFIEKSIRFSMAKFHIQLVHQPSVL